MLSGCLKPPIHRMGGKAFLSQWLNGFIPGHTLYCEPFAGAAHLLFGKMPSKAEILNDSDGHLIGFFQAIKDPEKRLKLVETLKYMPYSRSLWNELRFRWKAGDIPQDEVVRVSWWFYLNRTCFGGDQRRGGFGCPSVTGRNPVQSFRNSIEMLEDVAEKLRSVCLENLDYRECVQRYDSPGTLFYCDPPYLDAGHYYANSFALEDHHALARLLNDAKGKAMVSHYANGLYDGIYQGWRRFEYSSFKGSHKSEGEEKPKTVEVLYCNFKPAGRNKSLFPPVGM